MQDDPEKFLQIFMMKKSEKNLILTAMKTSDHNDYSPILLLVLLFSPCSASYIRNASYNYFLLVYTWPNTFCANRNVACKLPVPQNFTLHGLWPARRDGKPLMYCSKTGNISWALRKYEKILAGCWATLRRDLTNKQFWQHELEKHGTCAQPKVTILHYLHLIILQKGRFDLRRALSNNNIKPNGSSYRRWIVEAAIKQEITGGRNFYISCQNFKNGAWIKEIYICLDAYGVRVISCPDSDNPRGCGRKMNLVFSNAVSKRIYY